MSRFTTVLWDVDNTLLDFDYSQKYALTKCFRSIGRDITEEQIALYKQINDDYWRRLERGEVTKERLLTGRFYTLFRELGIECVDVEAFRQEYQTGLGSVFSFLDDSLNICRNLRGKVKQYVITNGVSAIQRNKLGLSGLAEVMDGFFISEEIGSPKPDSLFFRYCLEHVEEKDRRRILIVGDSMTSDIEGGMQAGIPTCWYNASGKAKDNVLPEESGAGDAAASRNSVSGGETDERAFRGNFAETGEGSERRPDYVIDDLHMVYGILGV